MFGILRILVGSLLGILVFVLVLKFVKIQSNRRFILILIIFLLITVLGFVPFENLVYSFKSAEEVYEYYYLSEKDVELVVEGKQSDFVVGRKNEVSTFLIVPKTSNGWKIGISLNTKKIVEKFYDGITVYIYQYKNTNDYFVTVFDIHGRKLNISDDYNTKFFLSKYDNGFLGKPFHTYYAFVSDYNQQFSITVNGNKINLGQ